MTIWLPFRGEFGSKLMWHVPSFNAAASHAETLICHEPNQDCLYPNAKDHYIVKPPEDYNCTGATGAPGDETLYRDIRNHFGPTEKYIHPLEVAHYPKKYFTTVPLKKYSLKPEVVLCKRMKAANFGKIWRHWDYVNESLDKYGISTYFADNYNTDEILWCMIHARLVLTIYTGSMFLCQLGGVRPHILCAEGKRECPAGMGICETLLNSHDVARVGWSYVPFWQDPDRVASYVVSEVRKK